MLAEQKVVGSNPVGCTIQKLQIRLLAVFFCYIIDGMNEAIFNFLGANPVFEKISDIILILALATLCVGGVTGLVQWIKRKSLKKVDKELLMVIPVVVFLVGVYFFFDKFCIVNYRPMIVDGEMKPSFPSTHTMLVLAIFAMTIMALPKYVKNKNIRFSLNGIMITLAVLVAFARLASGMHWFTDILGGIGFGAVAAVLYYVFLKKVKGKNE